MEVILYDPMIGNPANVPAEEWKAIMRAMRDSFLTECDWTQMPDSPLSDEARAEWATYRQALRDSPSAFDENPGMVWYAPDPPGYEGDPERPPHDPDSGVTHVLDMVWTEPEPAVYHIEPEPEPLPDDPELEVDEATQPPEVDPS